MHCELMVPALFARAPGARLPALELLLARSRSTGGEAASLERALCDAFGLEDEAIAAGALTRLAAGGDAGSAWWVRADPVHLRLMRDRLIVVPGEALGISREEASALCDALNAHFAGALTLESVHPERWCARLDAALELDTARALDVAGHEVDLSSRAEKRAQSLATEAQMLLHAHPVNEAREARGEPAVNSLWLWGAGSAPRQAAAPWRSVTAEDPVALGLARSAGAQARPVPPSADLWLGQLPEDGRHLVVLDALRTPHALGEEAAFREQLDILERRWFAPLLAALRAQRVGMVTVHVPDSPERRSFETVRGDLRRFWRRPRSLEHYA
jgi:hypothetical protein